MISLVSLGTPPQKIKDWIIDNNQQLLPFHFEALENGNIKLTKSGTPDEIYLLYSFDNKEWQDWDYTTGTNITAGQKLYLKAKTENINFYKYKFVTTKRVNISGNIMSLLYNDFIDKKEIKGDWCFYQFFSSTKIVNASNLILPATEITDLCYSNMFKSCVFLEQPPKTLPAKSLKLACYSQMFYGCQSLTLTPKLLSEKLTTQCCEQMFCDCYNLTLAPELPATQLAELCYSDMFSRCYRLTLAPELPATILFKRCYYNMFSECTRLSQAPELKSINIEKDCYLNMFQGCTNISELHYPIILKDDGMFNSISGVPNFGATNATVYFDL